ncbi:MAG: hypothetical protein HY834_09025 [Devosia nanyangense]|uniref:Beta sliding clamp n=1 Tax=Devosia nanyangense TaxID=1228055 RepID=A0A933NYM4_9HYPH|nr:hypothetical protein [Devosia nanyangense]
MSKTRHDFVTIDSAVLRTALKLVTKVTEKRNTYPVLGMVQFRVARGKLTLLATDLDIVLSLPVETTEGAGTWATCLNPWTLERIAKANAGELSFAPGETAARVGTSAGAFDLEAIDAASFPEMPGAPGAVLERFAGGALTRLIGKVGWCVSTEETRYYLNGVAWQAGPFGRRFAATDGHRLAICTYSKSGARKTIVTRVIPNKTVLLLRTIAAGDADVRAVVRADGKVDPLKIEIEAGGIVVRTKLVELPEPGDGRPGGYPNVDAVIPMAERWMAAFALDSAELSAALASVSAVRRKKDGFGAVKFSGEPGKPVNLTVTDPDGGSARAMLSALWPKGGASFGVNAHYLRDLVGNCAGIATFHQVGAGDPITVLDADATMTRVLMPMMRV